MGRTRSRSRESASGPVVSSGEASRAGCGVEVSSGPGDPAGDERGVGSISSMRWLRWPMPVGRLGVENSAGVDAGARAARAEACLDLITTGAATTALGMLSWAYCIAFC